MSSSPPCVFCRILSSDLPATFLYRDSRHAAIMDIHALTAGLRASGLRCEGVNLFLADGEAAIQEVFHAHLHVFPRYSGDGFGLRFGPHYLQRPRPELEAAAEKIRAALPTGFATGAA